MTIAVAAFPGQVSRARVMPMLRVPMWAILSYLVLTYALFFFWPINWPIYQPALWIRLSSYVAACFAAIAFGYLLGTQRVATAPAPFARPGPWIIAGAIVTIILLVPSSYLYTGRWPWQIMVALQEQGEAYRRLQDQLFETAGQRGPIALVRALAAPITFAVVPLGILNWRKISNPVRALVVAAALSAVVLSIMRGTDKQIADLILAGLAAGMVVLARGAASGGQGLATLKRYWRPALLLGVMLYFAAGLYTDRKNERLGTTVQRASICANDSNVCADLDHPALKWMPISQRTGATVFLLSAVQGYYGLELALEKDFQPTFGVGHSPAMLAVYRLFTGSEEPRYRTYTYRNGIEGWRDENYWSTLITWIANDVGFLGAIVFLFVIGVLFGKSWRDATWGHSDAAAMCFCILLIVLIYLPANNQFFLTYDGYTTAAVWGVLWLRGRRLLAAPSRTR